jgi:hypothetical protein
MKPSKDRDAYIVLAPTGKSKIYSVACRKIGSRDRYSVMATCQNEVNADSIVDGLKLLQGEVVKLEIVAQRTLVDVRSLFSKECARSNELRQKLAVADQELRVAKRELDNAKLQRDAAQKTARESA